MVKAELALELFVVQLDLPAHPSQARQMLRRRVRGQVSDPIVERLVVVFGPLADQPLLTGALGARFSQRARPGRAKTNREVTGSPSGPSRNVTVCRFSGARRAISSWTARACGLVAGG